MRFGEFLVSKGLVTEAEIESALIAQRQTRLLLEELAVECGYSPALQNVQIVLAQRRGGGSYGQIAKERGLLTGEQVEELAALQQETTMPLGKILTAETAMTCFQLIMALKEYVRLHRQPASTGGAEAAAEGAGQGSVSIMKKAGNAAAIPAFYVAGPMRLQGRKMDKIATPHP